MLAVLKKEIKSYFFSPTAYVLIALFIALTSVFFTPLIQSGYGDFSPMLDTVSFFLVFLVPILTMRLMTEDRKSGADALLLTSPTRLSAIVLGKYFAAIFVYLVLIALTWIYPLILVALGGVILPELICGYLGLLLLGAAFIAFGLFASSLTENQIIAAVIGIAGLMVIQVAEALSAALGGVAGKALDWFSLLSRYRVFTGGVLDLAPTAYFLSFIALFLFLAVQSAERRRWCQG